MATKEINALASFTTPASNTDIIHAKQGLTDKQISIAQLRSEVGSVGNFYTAGGTANNIDLTAAGNSVAVTEYFSGMVVTFFATIDNTAGVVLNINGLGGKAVKVLGQALVAGNILAGDLIVAVMDDTATAFEIITGNVIDRVATTVSGDKNFTGSGNVYNGIAQANLLDKTASETIIGPFIFSNGSTQLGTILLGDLVDKSAAEDITGKWTFSDLNLNKDAITAVTFTTAADWAKSAGYRGFINPASNYLPTDVVDFGYYEVLSKRDVSGGYAAIFVEMASGKTWIVRNSSSANPPTWTKLLAEDQAATISGQYKFTNGLTQFGSSAPGKSWDSNREVLELGSASAVMGGFGETSLIENAYYDGANWRYTTSDLASAFEVTGGRVRLLTTVTGTAGNVITWNEVLVGELDGTVKALAGNVLISPQGSDVTPNRECVVYNNASGAAYFQACNNTTGTSGTAGMVFGVDGGEQGYVWNYHNSNVYFGTNNLQELYLDTSNRGVVAGNASGEGKGEGTIHGPNGVYSKGTELIVPSSVAGFVASQSLSLMEDTGSSSNTLALDSVIVAGQWESVGPTGSPSTAIPHNIWTMLDQVPTTAKGLVLTVYNRTISSSTGTYTSRLYARKTGINTSAGNASMKSNMYTQNTSGGSEYASTMNEFIVPIDSERRFDVYRSTLGSVNLALDLSLVGWIE